MAVLYDEASKNILDNYYLNNNKYSSPNIRDLTNHLSNLHNKGYDLTVLLQTKPRKALSNKLIDYLTKDDTLFSVAIRNPNLTPEIISDKIPELLIQLKYPVSLIKTLSKDFADSLNYKEKHTSPLAQEEKNIPPVTQAKYPKKNHIISKVIIPEEVKNLIKDKVPFSFSELPEVGKKDDKGGINTGYVAKDARNRTHMVKTTELKYTRNLQDRITDINEITMSGMYNRILPTRSPKIGLVVGEKSKNKIALRSKFIDNFTDAKTYFAKGGSTKNIEGFEKIIAASIFCGERDLNLGNWGLTPPTKDNPNYSAVKIDHGLSNVMIFKDKKDVPIFLNKMMLGLYHYEKMPINIVNFRETLDQISKVSDDEIKNIVSSKVQELLDNKFDFTSFKVFQADVSQKLENNVPFKVEALNPDKTMSNLEAEKAYQNYTIKHLIENKKILSSFRDDLLAIEPLTKEIKDFNMKDLGNIMSGKNPIEILQEKGNLSISVASLLAKDVVKKLDKNFLDGSNAIVGLIKIKKELELCKPDKMVDKEIINSTKSQLERRALMQEKNALLIINQMQSINEVIKKYEGSHKTVRQRAAQWPPRPNNQGHNR